MERLKLAPLVLLCLFGAKALVLSPSLNEVLTLGALASVALFIEYKESNPRIKKLENDFKVLTELTAAHTVIVQEVRNNMSTIKIAQAYSTKPSGQMFGAK